jgi:hypothetical protein
MTYKDTRWLITAKVIHFLQDIECTNLKTRCFGRVSSANTTLISALALISIVFESDIRNLENFDRQRMFSV